MKNYESQIIGGCLASFIFSETTGPKAFQHGLNELKEWVKMTEIKYLMVNVTDMTTAWDKEAQQVWINTGTLCDENNILKWGVISPDLAKSYTIKYLIKGAGVKRNYKTNVSNSEKSLIDWFGI